MIRSGRTHLRLRVDMDVLADLVDDRSHGRDLTSARQKLLEAVASIEDR